MNRKLTEKQYKLLVDVADQCKTWKEVVELIEDFTSVEFGRTDAGTLFKVMALVNPETRDLTHDKYVEKEKRYVWNLSMGENSIYVKRLFMNNSYQDGKRLRFVSEYLTGTGDTAYPDDEKLTEAEVQEWGYNPYAFDKEEVK